MRKHKPHTIIVAICGILLFTGVQVAQAATGDLAFSYKWGSTGTGNGQLRGPIHIAVAPDDTVYLTDGTNHRVQKFTPSGTYVLQWGSQGSADGQFNRPTGIAVDASGNVYVMDTDNDRIQKFDANGNFLLKWGVAGSGAGEFDQAYGIAIANDGNLLTADCSNNTVNRYNVNTGTYLGTIGSPGSGNGQLACPTDVGVDAAGNIYVMNTGLYRVEVFSNAGAYLRNWGSQGTGDGQFTYPFSLIVSPENIVYVGDYLGQRLQAFSNQGVFLGKWGSQGIGDGQFYIVGGLALSQNGSRLFIADYGNDRVQVFDVEQTSGGPSLSPSPSGSASPSTSAGSGTTSLPRVGLPYWLLPVPLAMIAIVLYIVWDWQRHRKPLIAEDPNVKYTIWHHMRVVTIPLFKYRISFVVSHPTHTSEGIANRIPPPTKPGQSA